MGQYLLSSFIFTPLLAVLLLQFIPATARTAIRTVSLTALSIQFLLSAWIFYQFPAEATGGYLIDGYRFVEKFNWITLPLGSLGTLSIDYLLGVDGLNVAMVLLTGIVMLIGGIASLEVNFKNRSYWSLYLLLSASVAGCFVALDFFLFFVFFEFMLLPMYFLIGLWGGERREYAAMKFILFTLAGSVFILLVMMGLYLSVIDPVETALVFGLLKPGEVLTTDVVFELQQLLATKSLPVERLVHTFNMVYLSDASNFIPDAVLSVGSESRIFGLEPRMIAFIALIIGFGIKLPTVPLHTWLPDAHTEASTPISVVLAGILLKVGGYGFLRMAYPIFPEAGIDLALLIAVLGVLSIIYAAYAAFGQYDMKRMIAYSSVSHMGFFLLGVATLTVEGINGSIFQLFSHGLTSAMLFLIAGVLSTRTHDRMRDHYSGLVHHMPVYGFFAMFAFFAAMGLPGLSGFIGEALVLLGAFKSAGFNQLLPRWIAVTAALGILLSAVYFLNMARKMFLGPFWTKDAAWKEQLNEIDTRERIMLTVLMLLITVAGLLPFIILDKIKASVAVLVESVFYN
jgi:NADH-quinone oxidoreductase subunit M